MPHYKPNLRGPGSRPEERAAALTFAHASAHCRCTPKAPGVSMSKVTYEIVPHDGGWAYRVGETYSEAFPTHDAAREAAERAASEQRLPLEHTTIEYEDRAGRWHREQADDDRPEVDVQG